MILRFDRMLIDLPDPKAPSPNDSAAVQELLGGTYGEMSTLMHYTFQSFNFRGWTHLRPFYDLIANIATEEYGHVELVSYAKVHEDKGLHTKLYRFSPQDYGAAGQVWNGPHPEDGQPLSFEHLPANYGGTTPAPDLDPEPQLNAPMDPDHLAAVLKRLG